MADNYCQATVWPELPASLFDDAEIELLESACGLACEPSKDMLYFFAEEYFSEEGEDVDGTAMNCITLLQSKLQQLDASRFPNITIEGAHTCSKMRPGEFGGFAFFITRDEVQFISSSEWLSQRKCESNRDNPESRAGRPLPSDGGEP